MKKTKKYPIFIAAIGVIAITILITIVVLPTDADLGFAQIIARNESSTSDETPALGGTYVGLVALERAQPGEYGEPLPPPDQQPGDQTLPDLGEIDLGLLLIQAGQTVSGYVDLDYTLVFSAEHAINDVLYGPAVSGTFDGTDLLLESERTSFTSAGQRLMRQFQLTGQMDPEENNHLTGEYRETLWGYGPQPLTIIGEFELKGAPRNPGVKLVVTVGRDPATCATKNIIVVKPGTVVYYCYTIRNTGDVTLTNHALEDGLYGTIFDDLTYTLEPDATWNTVQAGMTISATVHTRTVNGATWTAFNPGALDTTLDGAAATVEIGIDTFLPLIKKP